MPYKIAISGLYKRLNFKMISHTNDKSVMIDDTCNFISCKTLSEMQIVYSLLISIEAAGYLSSIIFWDSKRPITTEILNSIDLNKIAKCHSIEVQYNSLMQYNNILNKENSQVLLFQ
jgi:hypothetical protein